MRLLFRQIAVSQEASLGTKYSVRDLIYDVNFMSRELMSY